MNQNNINSKNKFFKKTYEIVKYTKPKYDKFMELYNGTPMTLRILNIIIPLILTYIFTVTYYNKILSIIFGLITFCTMLLYNRPIAIIYIILYILIIFNISRTKNRIFGSPLRETNISKNKKPYNCAGNSLTVENSWFPKDINGGYFTYSFWLYVNGNNNNINKENNWNNYRYNEWKSIFYRGTKIQKDQDLSNLIQFPGFWLTPKINDLVIVFQDGSFAERLEINNIEFNQWINIVLVVEMKSVSIYINGLLDRTLNLSQNVSLMNNYNLYIANDKHISSDKKKSGFPGHIANLIYYNYALSVNDINTSYNYYKKIMNHYQKNIIHNNTSNFKQNNSLITNDMILQSS